MKKQKFLGPLLALGLGLTMIAAPAHASQSPHPPASTEHVSPSADYLEELEEIAGKPTAYTPAESEVQLMALDPAGCTLYPSRTHLRKSGGYGTVGAKPYTRCNSRVSRISQESTLFIVEWAGLVHKPMLTKSSANQGQQNLTQTNLAWTCKNSNNSIFRQETRGTTTVGTKNYYSLVTTIKDTWGCGY
jgi:hypothetical protein